MSRQRRRAIMRRLEKIKARDVGSQSADQLVNDLITMDRLRNEWRALTIEMLEQQPFLSPALARLYRHYKGIGRP